MKKKLLLLTGLLVLNLSIAFLISSCEPPKKKQYNFEVIYDNGDTVNLSYVGFGDNMFSLRNGDLTTEGYKKTLQSGVRSYKIISIRVIGKASKKECESHNFSMKPIN